MKKVFGWVAVFLLLPMMLWAQPEIPISEWTGRTILLIGAHPDDDAQ